MTDEYLTNTLKIKDKGYMNVCIGKGRRISSKRNRIERGEKERMKKP